MIFRDHSENKEEAAEFLRLALADIAHHKLLPTPVNYALFYEYAAGHNEILRKRLEEMLANPSALNQESLDQLCRTLLVQDEAGLAEMREDLRELIRAMNEEVTSVGGRFAQYGDVLRDFASILGQERESKRLRSSVDNVIEETSLTEKSRRAMEERLTEVLAEVDELKKNLELIREEALTDALTGIANRKAFDAALARAITETREKGNDVSIVMVDIDHFKQFNDTHGHLIGDKVLRFVAGTIRQCLKGKDIPARFGGEEFAIVLPNTDINGAEIVANQIRVSVSSGELKMRGTDVRLGKISVSAGVAQLRDTDSENDLIHRVDSALYRAKHLGRDRVEREAS